MTTLRHLGEHFARYVRIFILTINDFLKDTRLYDLLASISRDTLAFALYKLMISYGNLNFTTSWRAFGVIRLYFHYKN